MSPILLAMLAAGVIDRDTANRIERTTDPEALRVWAEAQLQNAFGGALNAQQGRLLDLLQANGYNPTSAQLDSFWAAESQAMWAATGNTLADVASETAILQATTANIADTFNFINQQTTDWVESYYFNPDVRLPGSIPQLNTTSRTQFARAFQDWRLGELGTVGGEADGLPQLIRAITPIFGAERAERIAVTETTRMGAESQRQIEAGEESTEGFRFLTAADETVCEICGPLHNQLQPKSVRTWNHPTLGAIEGPPMHVRCRCGVTPYTKLTANIRPIADDYEYDGPLPEAQP